MAFSSESIWGYKNNVETSKTLLSAHRKWKGVRQCVQLQLAIAKKKKKAEGRLLEGGRLDRYESKFIKGAWNELLIAIRLSINSLLSLLTPGFILRRRLKWIVLEINYKASFPNEFPVTPSLFSYFSIFILLCSQSL